MPLGRARPYLALASEFTRAALNAVAGRARVILPHIVESRRDASVPSSTVRARDYAAAGVTPMEDSTRARDASGASTSRPATENLPREFRFELPRVKGESVMDDGTHECARAPGREAKRRGLRF